VVHDRRLQGNDQLQTDREEAQKQEHSHLLTTNSVITSTPKFKMGPFHFIAENWRRKPEALQNCILITKKNSVSTQKSLRANIWKVEQHWKHLK
jgi:hypothetical protein